MKTKPSLVVMAAGIGSRYGGLKQIDPVGPNGEILLDYSVYDAIRAGFGRIVFIIRHDIESDFKSIVTSHFKNQVQVDYAFQSLENIPERFHVPPERTKPWGTGQAVLSCRDIVNEPFAVINADDFYGRESYSLIAGELLNSKIDSNDYCMAGFELSKTLSDHGHVARGICEKDNDGNLVSIVERLKIEKTGAAARYQDDDGEWHPLTGSETASMNMFGFTPTLFKYLEEGFTQFLEKSSGELKSEYLLPTLVGNLLGAKKIKMKILNSPEHWFGVTYKEDKPVVVENIKQLIASGVYPEKLW